MKSLIMVLLGLLAVYFVIAAYSAGGVEFFMAGVGVGFLFRSALQ